MRTISEGLHQIGLGPGVGLVNVFLLETAAGLVLIDTGFPGSADAILKAMDQLDFAPERLAHIVLTHAHPDHIGSLAALKRATGAESWMHADDAPLAERGRMRPVRPSSGLLPSLLFKAMSRMPQTVEPAQIDHIIWDDDELPFAGLRVIHAPGHCAGQIVLMWPERRLLFAADSCMHMLSLRLPLVNESAALALRSLQKIGAHDFETACFGHGRTILLAAASRFRRTFGTPES